MSGIYNAEAERQSIMATFPRFRAIEKEYGSLTRGMIAASRKRAAAPKPATGQKTSAFISLYGGTNELIDALVPQLSDDLRLNTQVSAIHARDGGYLVQLEEGVPLEADVVIITTPSYVTADLVQSLTPDAAETLREIRYVSNGTISLAFKSTDIPKAVGRVRIGHPQQREATHQCDHGVLN